MVLRCGLQIRLQIQCHILRLFGQIPHFQKHDGKRPDRFTGEHQSCVLPVSETFLLIDVFISKVYTAVKSSNTIYYKYFSVVTVVEL